MCVVGCGDVDGVPKSPLVEDGKVLYVNGDNGGDNMLLCNYPPPQ